MARPAGSTPPWTPTTSDVAGLHGFIAFLEGDIYRMAELVTAIPPEFDELCSVATMTWMHEMFVAPTPMRHTPRSTAAAPATHALVRPESGASRLRVG